MKITLVANPSDAPCCIKVEAEDGRSLLVQQDWEWPAIAGTFGWDIKSAQKEDRNDNPCDHRGTDGTVVCPDCGTEPGVFIHAARDWIDDNDGAEVEDPGYFEGDADADSLPEVPDSPPPPKTYKGKKLWIGFVQYEVDEEPDIKRGINPEVWLKSVSVGNPHVRRLHLDVLKAFLHEDEN